MEREGVTVAEPLRQLQTDLAAFLRAHSYFDDIEIEAIRDREQEGIIDAVLTGSRKRNSVCGLAVSVLIPTADALDKTKGPRLTARGVIRVQEIPTINNGAQGTGLAAEDVALTILQYLHMARFGGEIDTVLADDAALTPSMEFDPKLTYDVRYRAPLALTILGRVAAPTITDNGSTVTLATTTASASIYYATGTTYPSAAAGTLYSAPFATPASGVKIRAAAYLAGSVGSNVTELTI